MLYSYKGQEPQALPSRIYLDDGSTLTGVERFSEERLKSHGFRGPYVKPKYDELKEKIVWNGIDYQIFPLNQSEKLNIQKLKGSYNYFWHLISNSSIYKRLRIESSKSLVMNIFGTEIISLFIDAKLGNPDIEKIQKYLNVIFLILEVSDDEKEEIQNCLVASGLDSMYKLPSEEFVLSHSYDFEQDLIKTI